MNKTFLVTSFPFCKVTFTNTVCWLETKLIQENWNTKTIRKELKKILDSNYRQMLLDQYEVLEEKLGGIGASQKTAKLIVGDLK